MGVTLLGLMVNLAVSVLYMVVYGHLIGPGHEKRYDRDHIKVALQRPSSGPRLSMEFSFGNGFQGTDVVGNSLYVMVYSPDAGATRPTR